MPRPKKIGNPYKGELVKPIIIPEPPPHLGILHYKDPQKKAEHEKKVSQYTHEVAGITLCKKMEKLLLLEEHYKIKERFSCADDPLLKMMFLCLELASNHIEGFRVQTIKSSGRKKKWDNTSHALLYFDVTKKIEEKGNSSKFGVSWACKELIKSPSAYWSSFLNPKMSGENRSKILENEFSKSKNSPLVKLTLSISENVTKEGGTFHTSEIFKILDSTLRPRNKQS